ncbi:DUF1049 domain-containing protein [Streptomyces zagrosensis]|uniref:Putative integral membrane protein n=1 Tax=Streptomyces zagrosensis TaxID=1042984 RepID=A0A7W9QC26_9ACTN|nr:DUF1049 domain-containing protein [Streptomyces zagrosensis]MBB5937399.1 putative integral membrane protein [Streptomyces zagrosensis]
MSPKAKTDGGGRGSEFFTPGRIALLIVAILGLVFIFENTRQVKIRLLIPEVTMPLWLALAAVTVIGGLCGAYLFRRR